MNTIRYLSVNPTLAPSLGNTSRYSIYYYFSQVVSHSSMEQFSMKNAKYLHLLGKDIRVAIEIALIHRIALMQKNHGLLLWNRVGDAIYGMPQSLAQCTCTKIGSAEVTCHCGQSPDDHSLQCQGECQTVSLRGNPILYTEIKKCTPCILYYAENVRK